MTARPQNGPYGDQELQMLTTMAAMQAEHNEQVHPDWQTQGYEYYRAIWVECAELMDHFGWKWWKHQTPDLDQARLELVDIWHFGLSELLRDGVGLAEVLDGFADLPLQGSGNDEASATASAADAAAFRAAVEDLAGATLASQRFVLAPFVAACTALPMSYRELFELYIGKNVLNRFRQSHGYKEGTYRKLWDGREDNEHLVEVLAAEDAGAPDIVETILERLEARYASHS